MWRQQDQWSHTRRLQDQWSHTRRQQDQGRHTWRQTRHCDACKSTDVIHDVCKTSVVNDKCKIFVAKDCTKMTSKTGFKLFEMFKTLLMATEFLVEAQFCEFSMLQIEQTNLYPATIRWGDPGVSFNFRQNGLSTIQSSAKLKTWKCNHPIN